MGNGEKSQGQLLQELAKDQQQAAIYQEGEAPPYRNKEFYEDLTAAVRGPLLVLDADLRVVLASRTFCDVFQVTPDETQGRLFYELGSGQWNIPKLRLLLAEILPQKTEFDDFAVDSDFAGIGHKTLLLNARQLYREGVGTNLILLLVYDVTQRRRDEKASRDAEKMLQQSSRLASIGLLTTGITHELNNPLGIILGYSELALTEPLNQRVRHYVEAIHEATERAAQIVRNVLSFAREGQLTNSIIEVQPVLERAIGLKAYEFAVDNIIVTKEFTPEPLTIKADPFQLVEAILSILTNAQQAITGAHRAGAISINVGKSADRVAISIEDNGPGIPAEHIGKIFDPFFTTKEIGKGTGLGLSITHGIILQHGGEVWAESTVGKGATFHIELPISSGIGVEEAPAPEPRELAVKTLRILVVNDEPAFRELLTITLSADGHVVDRAKDGEEAWDMVHSQEYDCIVINLWMPKMGGQLLYALIKDYSHELARRCIFITGATRSVEVQEFIADTGNPSLSKPFPLDEIRRLVLRS